MIKRKTFLIMFISMMFIFSLEEGDSLTVSQSYKVEDTTVEEISVDVDSISIEEVPVKNGVEETTTIEDTSTINVIEETTIVDTTIKEVEQQETTFVELTTTETIEIIEPSAQLPNSYIVYGNPITYSCDESLNEKCDSYIRLVPDEILSLIRSNDYQIHIVETPGEEYGYKNICGLTMPSKRLIHIEANERKFKRNVVHEIAHAYDHCLGWVSNTDEFMSIFNEEVSKFNLTIYNSNHYKDNNKEYFAEAFQMYIYDPENLIISVPKTYEFMKDYIDGERVCCFVY